MDNISVIITYSGKLKLLAKNLDALKTQLQPGDEIVLVDDSTESVEDFVKGVPYINYIKLHDINLYDNNMVMSRNRGALMAVNSILVFLDEDMLPSEHLIEEYRKVVPDNDIVCGRINWLTKGGKLELDYRVDNRKFKGKSIVKMSKLANYGLGGGGNFAMLKSLFMSVGGFNAKFNGRWGNEDIDLYRRTLKLGNNLHYNSSALAVHQYHERNLNGFEKNRELLDEIWGTDWKFSS